MYVKVGNTTIGIPIYNDIELLGFWLWCSVKTYRWMSVYIIYFELSETGVLLLNYFDKWHYYFMCVMCSYKIFNLVYVQRENKKNLLYYLYSHNVFTYMYHIFHKHDCVAQKTCPFFYNTPYITYYDGFKGGNILSENEWKSYLKPSFIFTFFSYTQRNQF